MHERGLPSSLVTATGGRWLVGITIVLLAWLTVSSAIAFRLTRRPRAWFPEPAPHVPWGSIEDHRLRTRDGQDIGAWFVEGEDKDNAPQILLLHGNKGSRANSLKRAEFLASAGYPVFMISLRTHGDSTGDFNDIGYSARQDISRGPTTTTCSHRPRIATGTWSSTFVALRPGD